MNDFKEKINRTRRDNTKRLCILMMIADRDIDELEIKKIIEIIQEDSMFAISEEEILNLINEVSSERYESNLKHLVDKYSSGIKNKDHQLRVLSYLEAVMDANGERHSDELRMIELIKSNWNI
jgi:uncharacterized tellurite resistance protein B-like protein